MGDWVTGLTPKERKWLSAHMPGHRDRVPSLHEARTDLDEYPLPAQIVWACNTVTAGELQSIRIAAEARRLRSQWAAEGRATE